MAKNPFAEFQKSKKDKKGTKESGKADKAKDKKLPPWLQKGKKKK